MSSNELSRSLSLTPSDAQGKPLGVCPQCGSRLEAGAVAVQGTFWGWVMVGWSYQQLWFRPRLGEQRRVLESGESRRGWRCADCGFVGVAAPGRNAPSFKERRGR
jgi:DNA-directed RNA polymerase subunit RPC12/RpoP